MRTDEKNSALDDLYKQRGRGKEFNASKNEVEYPSEKRTAQKHRKREFGRGKKETLFADEVRQFNRARYPTRVKGAVKGGDLRFHRRK